MDLEWKLYDCILKEKYNDVTIIESDINKNSDDSVIEQIDNNRIYNDKFNEEENIEVSDLLCDVFFTLEMRDIEIQDNDILEHQYLELTPQKRKEQYESNLIEVSTTLTDFIHSAKMMIIGTQQKINIIQKEEKLDEESINILNNYIDSIRRIISNKFDNDIFEINFSQIRSLIEKTNNAELDSLVLVINKLVSAIQNEENIINRKRLKSKIYKNIRKIPRIIGRRYEKTDNLLSELNELNKLNNFKIFNRIDRKILLAKIIINYGADLDTYLKLKTLNIMEYVQSLQRNLCIKGIYKYRHNFIQKIEEMKNFIYETNGFSQYRRKINGCFAYMEIISFSNVKHNMYAFSKLIDCTDITISKNLDIKTNDVILDAMEKIGIKVLSNAFWARTNGDICRYVKENGDPINGQIKGFKIIPTTLNTQLSTCLLTDSLKKELSSAYSCCERKMIVQKSLPSQNLKKCYLFSRHEVCFKCSPALKDFRDKLGITPNNFEIYYTNEKEIYGNDELYPDKSKHIKINKNLANDSYLSSLSPNALV